MAGKRSAGYDLNADNWDQEDEPEERGIFKTASSDELKNRVIKKATRRRMPPSNDGETPKPGAFASFSGFSKSNSAATTLSASSSSPFSFLSKMASVTSASSLVTSSPSSNDNTDNKNGNNHFSEEYHSKLKGLNLAVLEWIKSHLDKNPLVILSPIFKDYEKHLTEIQKSNSNTDSKDKVKIISDFQLDTHAELKENKVIENDVDTFSFAKSCQDEVTKSTVKPTFSFGVKSPQNETTKTTLSIDANPPVPLSSSKTFSFGSKSEDNAEKTGFSFGSSLKEGPKAPFTFGASGTTTSEAKPFNFGASPKSDNKDGSVKPTFSFEKGGSSTQTSAFSFSGSAPFSFSGVVPAKNISTDAKEEEDENDEPPKVEFIQVEENDSVFSKKCKVFVKNDDKFGDRGVGTLHLKPVEGQKKIQLIVRADTNLGNLLLNLLLNESVPTKRMGKKDVLLVGVPMPTDKKPTQILIRVKTEEEADKLLETLEKHKKQE